MADIKKDICYKPNRDLEKENIMNKAMAGKMKIQMKWANS